MTISKANEEVRNSEYSIRTIATKYNMKASALSYHIGEIKNQDTRKCQTRNKIFPARLEEDLKDYILMSADSNVELDPQNNRI